MTEERRIQITDVRVLRALANPIRYRILGHLMSSGAQTASECAAIVGASPSNCSYHLRELERFGLVERAAGDDSAPDGRDRPWRPTVTGYGTGPAALPDADPAAIVATEALSHLGIDDNAALAHAAIDASCCAAGAVATRRNPLHLWAAAERRRAEHAGRRGRRPPAAVHRPDAERCARGRRAGARGVRGVPTARGGTTGMIGSASPLRLPGFRRLWVGGLVNDLGDWALLIALPVFVFDLTGSALTTSTVFVVELIAGLIAGQAAGVFVDRWDRRRILVVAGFLQAAALLPLLLVTSEDGLWIVYVSRRDRVELRSPVRAGEGGARAVPRATGQSRVGERIECRCRQSGPARRVAARRTRDPDRWVDRRRGDRCRDVRAVVGGHRRHPSGRAGDRWRVGARDGPRPRTGRLDAQGWREGSLDRRLPDDRRGSADRDGPRDRGPEPAGTGDLRGAVPRVRHRTPRRRRRGSRAHSRRPGDRRRPGRTGRAVVEPAGRRTRAHRMGLHRVRGDRPDDLEPARRSPSRSGSTLDCSSRRGSPAW